MELDEIANRIRNISQLERLEQQPAAPYDPAEAMENLEEAKNYIRFLYVLKTDDIHPPKTGISVHFSCSLS